MNQNDLHGSDVTLRPATLADRRRIYEWLACSDVAALMAGPPLFPERPVPTWEEFCEDYAPHFFDDTAPLSGRCFVILSGSRPVGQVNYNDIVERDGARQVELDIWMACRSDCGHGWGSDALATLCEHLRTEFDVRVWMVQPSARNPAAIRAYEKAGFRRLNLPLEAACALWGPNDYDDSVHMVKRVGAE